MEGHQTMVLSLETTLHLKAMQEELQCIFHYGQATQGCGT